MVKLKRELIKKEFETRLARIKSRLDKIISFTPQPETMIVAQMEVMRDIAFLQELLKDL